MDEWTRLERIADYQFGAGASDALFGDTSDLTVTRSKSGRPRQIHAPDGRLVSLGLDGRFTLGFAGGRRLKTALDAPSGRVYVGDESDPFVRDGRNAFAKFVTEVDTSIRSDDEVLVVRADDTLLGVGRAELPAAAMADLASGVAVSVRDGAGE
ncbi:PUA domain-containing protein [Halorhabdus sp. BNX81]|uniref:PUA domain-containing protein n=1 Tax=Halorhabdus sp. BNX81 TaxID=2980181 RepID=UPI0023DD6657|nr:PUA domain-containing protein [Halorhabdus sp. BNX81]WEL21398.1 tRNA modification protein, contains pre-PUA and PUA domains [Halorhabdus sp. BNX81]